MHSWSWKSVLQKTKGWKVLQLTRKSISDFARILLQKTTSTNWSSFWSPCCVPSMFETLLWKEPSLLHAKLIVVPPISKPSRLISLSSRSCLCLGRDLKEWNEWIIIGLLDPQKKKILDVKWGSHWPFCSFLQLCSKKFNMNLGLRCFTRNGVAIPHCTHKTPLKESAQPNCKKIKLQIQGSLRHEFWSQNAAFQLLQSPGAIEILHWDCSSEPLSNPRCCFRFLFWNFRSEKLEPNNVRCDSKGHCGWGWKKGLGNEIENPVLWGFFQHHKHPH